MKIKFLILALVAASLIPGVTACSNNGPTSLAIDQPVPDFTLPGMSGQNVSLSSQTGKTVVINFWATTCQPCRDEMPYFQAFYDSWKNRGVVFLPVNIGENSGTVAAFLRDFGLTFPVLLDSQGEVAGKYGVQFTPTTLFIGKDGRLKSEVVGAFKDKAAIENHLQSLLN
jgi:peroxiredoxin